jgi:energy-coupling factor transport system ATP-binding protein
LSAGGGHLLLDEPLAQLDPRAARDLLARLRELADSGHAVLMVEHRLEMCLPWCDRLAVMHQGRLTWQGEVAELPLAHLRELGLTLPGMIDLQDRLGTVDLARVRFAAHAEPEFQAGKKLLSLASTGWCWPGTQDGLGAISLSVHRGERVALVGGNGAGKSTLLGLLSGRLQGAQVERNGTVVEVPQDPDLSLFCATVSRELLHGPQEQRLDPITCQERVQNAASALSLGDLLDRPPQALSRGQRLRVAVAAGLSCRPEILMLDEPTAGQDREQVERMLSGVSAAMVDGALIFATHDLDLALRHATRVVHLEDGQVVQDGSPTSVLGDLPADTALLLPPLAEFCLARGLSPATAEQLASRAVET